MVKEGVPSPFTHKQYRVETQYHVYNRGAFKQEIFREEEDYWIFRKMLRETWQSMQYPPIILTFCLMPNHFHFRFYQEQVDSISKFMKSVWTRYTIYYRKKYDHSGCLCQGPYKAARLSTRKKQLERHLYILNNPIEAGFVDWPHVGNRPW
jgi:putative transposase